MSEGMQTKSLVEASLLSALTVLLSLLGIYLPLIGAIISFAWPIPIIILGIRHGLKWSLLATVVSGIVLSLLVSPLQVFTLVLGFGLMGIVLGETMKRELPVGAIIGLGALASLFSKLILFGLAFLLLGMNALTDNFTMLQQTIQESLQMYRTMGISPDQLAVMQKTMEQTMQLMKIIFPALLVLVSLLDTLFNYFLSQIILKRLGYTVKPIPPFTLWRMPKLLVLGFAIGMTCLLVGHYYQIELLSNIGLNLQYFSMLIFLVQGFAVTAYLLKKWNVSKVLRFFILLLLFLTPLLVEIVIWIGLFDLFFDYRRLHKPDKGDRNV